MSVTCEEALATLPDGLRADVIGAFNEIVNNYRERRWEPSELNGAKLCEATYTIVLGWLNGGAYPARSAKPPQFAKRCLALESEHQSIPNSHSARVLIPRMLIGIYDIRNHRGVGHVGGDVNPNHMDATVILYSAKWVMAELVRLIHTVTTTEATEVVDGLIQREVAWVWALGDKKRVLRTGMTWKQQTLVLLLTEAGEVRESDLLSWLEHKDARTYRRDVLKALHQERSLEYDAAERTVRLLPPGVAAAEALIAA